jgi:hypothetical protein
MFNRIKPRLPHDLLPGRRIPPGLSGQAPQRLLRARRHRRTLSLGNKPGHCRAKGWKLTKNLWATPTIVLFRDSEEATRYTGYNGEKKLLQDWLGYSTLSEK